MFGGKYALVIRQKFIEPKRLQMSTEPVERDTIEVDILCVGAGVASLITVLRLLRQCKKAGGEKPTVLVIEKGSAVGAHTLSGAVVDLSSLSELLTPEELKAMPVQTQVKHETICRLTASGSQAVPWVPAAMHSHGMPIVSLSSVVRWLGGLVEAEGGEVYTGTPGAELLWEGDRVVGVRTSDSGWDKHGKQRHSFVAGADLRAKVVVLGEGAAGYLTEKLVERKQLAAGRNPQAYAIGIKELINVPEASDRVGHVIHSFGYPLDSRTYGGGFVYRVSPTQVAVGLVMGLDYRPAELDTHDLFRAFKAHPLIAKEIAGGEAVAYGAKVLPEAGYFAIPELVTDGAIIVGDAGGLLDSVRLKGVHMAVYSGIAAGDMLWNCWQKKDWSLAALKEYPTRLQATQGWKDLHKIRNVRASFKLGTLPGVMATGMSLLTGGLLPPGRVGRQPDYAAMCRMGCGAKLPEPPKANTSKLQLDLLTDLFLSGTKHEEDQPSHLHIGDPKLCRQCKAEFDAPCTRFCPAQVYEWDDAEKKILVSFTNCLHCKTCQIKNPKRNIEWVPPEGGGGPVYRNM
jgi:electron-transferring-flavoprotein dehydrogenase